MIHREYIILSLLIAFLLPVHTYSQTLWGLPGTSVKNNTKKTPRLVNYAHRSGLLVSTYGTDSLEERLAQWDVIILNPDYNLSHPDFSYDRIREINPEIKILAWIPMQGPGKYDSLKHGFNPAWSLKTPTGDVIEPWGFPLANPFADNYGYSKHVINFIENKVPDVDGIMFDVLQDYPWSGADYNEDGIINHKDRDSLRASQIFMLDELKRLHPGWILTGNGGPPWSQTCKLYDHANGPMHENALGNEFGDPGWQYTWDTYSYIGEEGIKPIYHFIMVDVRMDRSQNEAQELDSLTADDMRRFRMGIVGTMLRDYGYFGFDRGDCLHGQLWWFKEYDADLGNPLSDYESGVYGNSILSREFENASIILNPTLSELNISFEAEHTDVSFDSTGYNFKIPAQDARIFLKYSEPAAIPEFVPETNDIKECMVFPNPANDLLNICYESKSKTRTELYVYDMIGHLMIQKSYNINQTPNLRTIDISVLSPGIYTLTMKNNKYNSVKRFIKK